MSVKILIGDCREVMPSLGREQFDACITDPPYGDTSLDWDSRVLGWADELLPTLKPNASLWVFGSMRFIAPLFETMAELGLTYAQNIVWEKQNGTGFHADRFRCVHEHAVMWYRGAWANVYKQPQYTNDARARTVRRKKRPAHTGHIEASHYTSVDGGPRLMRSVLKVRNEHGRAIHPTQKPVELLLPLLRFSVPVGGSVIDPFGGSGSLGIAANVHQCDATLIELDSSTCAAARRRLACDAPLFAEVATA